MIAPPCKQANFTALHTQATSSGASTDLNPTNSNGGAESITNNGIWEFTSDYGVATSYPSGGDATGMAFNNAGTLSKTAGDCHIHRDSRSFFLSELERRAGNGLSGKHPPIGHRAIPNFFA